MSEPKPESMASLQAKCATDDANYVQWLQDQHALFRAELAALRRDAERCRQHAERYRWLRERYEAKRLATEGE